jgi:uncharacterized protein (DUF983 family)
MAAAAPTERGSWRTLWAIVRQRCPRCHCGKIFRRICTINDPCPTCGLVFQREEGFFVGAMYLSYPFALAILVPLFFLLSVLLPDSSSNLVAVLATLLFLPLVPIVFRYSRVIWIYLDRRLDPHGHLSNAIPRSPLVGSEAQAEGKGK